MNTTLALCGIYGELHAKHTPGHVHTTPLLSLPSFLLSSFFSTLFPHSSHSTWVYTRKLARAGPWRKMEARTWRSRSCFCISMRRSISCPVRLCVTSSSASPTASLSPSPSLLACQVPVPPPLSSSPPALPKLLPAPSPWDSAGIVLIIHIFWKRNRITMKTIHLLIPLGVEMQVPCGEKRGRSLYEGTKERTRRDHHRS